MELARSHAGRGEGGGCMVIFHSLQYKYFDQGVRLLYYLCDCMRIYVKLTRVHGRMNNIRRSQVNCPPIIKNKCYSIN